jgi:hypothetical protein
MRARVREPGNRLPLNADFNTVGFSGASAFAPGFSGITGGQQE